MFGLYLLYFGFEDCLRWLGFVLCGGVVFCCFCGLFWVGKGVFLWVVVGLSLGVL